ncbi:MAG: carbohydrate kinase family protein [Chloroflexi bacterium]|nr:carbohydrate kinase family protein [Chloroflexota bacterium]MCL5949510.1 carbohydrate kinase family protein [Candidatus Bathyarchaeota archaeon]
MSLAACKTELQSFLEKNPKECKVVVMPDFFLDRLINLDWDALEFSRLVAKVAKRKGGSLDGIRQTDLRGGNAINVASALTSLGAKVTPIVCTSEFGLQQIKYHFKNTPIDTSHIKKHGKASITTALEFKNKDEKANVMLRDLGALADFGPANLGENDYALIEAADYVCLFNWAGTLKFGTELAQAIFHRAKRSGKGKTYFDTADPTPKAKAIPDLMDKVLKTDKVDILSLNENEAITYASLLDESLKEKKERLGFAELAMEAARVLAKHLPARIDLHTTVFSATLKGKHEVVVPTFKVKVLRATGAGDAWCAGNILGDHNGLSDECRLMLANAVAACYLSDADGLHPTKEKLSTFLRKYT